MSMSMGYVGGVLGRLGFGGSNISCMYMYVLAQDNTDRLCVCVYLICMCLIRILIDNRKRR